MTDGRSFRKAKVVPFISKFDMDRAKNFNELIKVAKCFEFTGFEDVNWEDDLWTITGGRLTKLPGRKVKRVSIEFNPPEKLSFDMTSEWKDVTKALFLHRFHARNQSLTSQRFFITAVLYIANAADTLGKNLISLTPEALNNACVLISKHYKETTAYSLHKYVCEFAAHCDSNKLCKTLFKYKYAGMKRPSKVGGVGGELEGGIDDKDAQDTAGEKIVAPEVYAVIGELYRNVPKSHKYRLYVLMLTLFACLGRRFSEISLLPNQSISRNAKALAFIEYFPEKQYQGDTLTPKRKLYLYSQVVGVVEEVLYELESLTAASRATAIQMHKNKAADLRFLENISESQKLYPADLRALGISDTLLTSTGWLRQKDCAWPDYNAKTLQGRAPANPIHFTYVKHLREYCSKYYEETSTSVIRIDQFGKEYFTKDFLFIRPVGISSGTYAPWLATICTHSMFSTFQRYLESLVEEFASKSLSVSFTSHHFRHTLNTLLDEGGLSDLMQTHWFARSNPGDTKAYQHTSPAKRALMLHEAIKGGKVGGRLAEQIEILPVELHDAILKARIQAVHDVGPGLCIHPFSQIPCEKHLECSADCKDYLWVKDDKGRLSEQKRQYAINYLALETAEAIQKSTKPKKSIDWINHTKKKLKTLGAQLNDNGVFDFKPIEYLKEIGYGKEL